MHRLRFLSRLSGWPGPLWLAAISLLLVSGLLVHTVGAQQASRYALTAAIVDDGTVVLDDYVHVLGQDRAVRDGHVYSDKAPGQPVLATPAYYLIRTLGWPPATDTMAVDNIGVWFVTLWSSTLPSIALLFLMYRRLDRLGSEHAVASSTAVAFGTLLLPFSGLLFGHVMTAVLLYAAYLLLGSESTWGAWLSGFLAGLAVTTEYTAALGVAVLLVYAALYARRRLPAVLAGGLVPAACLAAYQWVAFGSPIATSYQYSAFHSIPDERRSLFFFFEDGSIGTAIQVFFGTRGIFTSTPIIALAVGAAILAIRGSSRSEVAREACWALVMLGVFALVPVMWSNPWGGSSPGPRYLTPAIPFLAVSVSLAFSKWKLATPFAAVASVVTMFSATITDPTLSPFSSAGLGTWVRLVAEGALADSIPEYLWGTAGKVIFGGVLAVAFVTVSAILVFLPQRERSVGRLSPNRV